MIGGTVANAAIKTWDRGAGTNDTNTGGNWNPDGVPSTTDFVVIPPCGTNTDISGCPTMNAAHTWLGLRIEKEGTLTVGANTLTVTSAGSLFIEDAGSLSLNSATSVAVLSGGGVYVVDGLVDLTGAGAKVQFTTADAVLSGNGRIRGSDETAKLEIGSGLRFTNRAVIEGALEIDKVSGTEPTFINDGLVHANRSGTPFILTLDDVAVRGHGEFRIGPGNSSDEMYFTSAVTATQLDADFAMYTGILDIDADVVTAGRLYFVDGVIEVAQGVVFISN